MRRASRPLQLIGNLTDTHARSCLPLPGLKYGAPKGRHLRAWVSVRLPINCSGRLARRIYSIFFASAHLTLEHFFLLLRFFLSIMGCFANIFQSVSFFFIR